MLKAVKPELIKPSKPKFMISGKSGVGKTTFSLDFEKPYFIDCEGGATREQYTKKLVKSGGAYFGVEQGSQDFGILIDEIKQLGTTKHEYKTLIIDSFSKLYNTAAAIAEESVGNDYGRDRKEANKPTRQLLRWINKIDMTVILVCHLKDKWERKGKDVVYTGTTFDGWDKLEYDLDLWLEVQKVGNERSFVVKKSRVQSFVEGVEYPLSYKNFSEMYGKEVIESLSSPIVMASPAQVAELRHLVEVVRLDEDVIEKWKTKASADDFSEFSQEQIEKCIQFVKSKIEAKGDK